MLNVTVYIPFDVMGEFRSGRALRIAEGSCSISIVSCVSARAGFSGASEAPRVYDLS